MERHYCLLDLSYSSNLLSTKIADIPLKLKYEIILAPIFEYCFGTSDKGQVWNNCTDEENSRYKKGEYLIESNQNCKHFLTIIDWIRDETFIFNQIFHLVEEKLDILVRTFGLGNNRRFILNACSSIKSINLFNSMNKKFRNDRELILALVSENGRNLDYASSKLRNDREIVKRAVKQNGFALARASKELRDDKELGLLSLETCNGTYVYLSDRLKNDRDVIIKALTHGFPIYNLDKKFNSDRELLLLYSKWNGKDTLEFACSELRKDKEIVMQAVKNTPFAFEFVSNELKRDREFVKQFVMINGEYLRFFRKFDDDQEIVELALKSSPDAIHFISFRFRIATEFMSNIIAKRGFKKLANEFSNDREIVLKSIKLNRENLLVASNELQNDREFIIDVVKNCGRALEFVNERFKSDREIIMEAITQDGNALDYVPNQFFDDKELVIKAAKTAINGYTSNFYYRLSTRLQNDRDLFMQCAMLYNIFPRKYQLDREILVECLKTNPFVEYFAYPFIASERVFPIRMVKKHGLLLRYLPLKYRNDREIVSFAIQQNKEALKYASDELQNDLEILKLIN